jgi:hypothetical protein
MKTFGIKSKCLAYILLIGMCETALGNDGYFSLSTGVEYASGDYGGDTNIEEMYVPLTAVYRTASVGYRLTVPYLSVKAPSGTIITDSEGQPVIGEGESTTESGLGDVVAGITIYDVYLNDSRDFSVDLSANVKFGTANENKGLGTGENDYSIHSSAYKFFGQYTLNASVGYKFRGNPSGLELNDVWFGSVGTSYRFNRAALAGIDFDYRQSSFDDGDAIQELTAFAVFQPDNTWGIQIYTFTGFSDSSPDWGVGALIKYYP